MDLLLQWLPQLIATETNLRHTCDEYFAFLGQIIRSECADSKEMPEKFQELLQTLLKEIKARPVIEVPFCQRGRFRLIFLTLLSRVYGLSSV
jgi:hypothetical protein